MDAENTEAHGARLEQRFRAGQSVPADTVSRALDNLQAASPTSQLAASLYLPAGGQIPALLPALSRNTHGPSWIAALENAGNRVLRADNGVAAFRVDQFGLAILPGFPLDFSGLTDTIETNPLRALLTVEHTVGVALLRLGRYAIAVYRGKRLMVSKTDTRYVKGKHHAGGTSQRRFQRVRENQIHRLYAEAARILEQQWRPYVDDLDYVALGGEASTINGFVKESGFLQRLSPITLPGRLDVREPNRAALDQVGSMLYECRVYPLHFPD